MFKMSFQNLTIQNKTWKFWKVTKDILNAITLNFYMFFPITNITILH